MKKVVFTFLASMMLWFSSIPAWSQEADTLNAFLVQSVANMGDRTSPNELDSSDYKVEDGFILANQEKVIMVVREEERIFEIIKFNDECECLDLRNKEDGKTLQLKILGGKYYGLVGFMFTNNGKSFFVVTVPAGKMILPKKTETQKKS